MKENRINQIMELANGKKYIVIKQAVYKENNYFVSLQITDKEDEKEELVIFQEIKEQNQQRVKKVNDPNLFALICKYVNLLDECRLVDN